MRHRAFFRRYLVIHFWILLLLPIFVLMMATGVYPASEQADEDTFQQFHSMITLIGLILALFLLISWVFFYRLRKRLLRLQQAMSAHPDGARFPHPVSVRTDRMDEVDQLEASFNRMIRQLEESRLREREETALRQTLIANLSHDLRTPLTVIRGHVSQLGKEPLSAQGRASMEAVDRSVTHMGELMDGMLSYTLLTSGKYPYRPVPTNMLRFVRASVASWYPAFENAGFTVEVDIPEQGAFSWDIDPQWMTRVLDNLFQNVLRHAGEGRFVGVAVDAGLEQLIIKDHGPGMDTLSGGRGAGIGLEISTLMLAEMRLEARFVSGTDGTGVWIGKIKPE